MKDTHQSHDHDDEKHPPKKDVVESFKEEGMLTVETLDVATENAMAKGHTHRTHGKGFNLSTPSAIILGACIIAVSIVAYGFIVKGSNPSAPTTAFAGREVDKTDFIEGNEKSDVVVIEYSDSECPFCMQLHTTIKQIRIEYADDIAFVYRHFPLTQIHPGAFDESRAITCAGNVGGSKKFYEYIDSLFGYKITNNTTVLPANGKEEIAKNVGLDSTLFAQCMKDDSVGDLVNASIQDGVVAGVQGTPSTFVLKKTRKGYEVIAMIDGARPYSFIKAAIDEALRR